VVSLFEEKRGQVVTINFSINRKRRHSGGKVDSYDLTPSYLTPSYPAALLPVRARAGERVRGLPPLLFLKAGNEERKAQKEDKQE